jgi:molybdopterin-binding protein
MDSGLAASLNDEKRRLTMKLSARNRIKGTIVEVKKGATTAHVRIDVGGGQVVTAAITNEAVDELGLAQGKSAYAVIKASDVMIGVD